jgi:hypothetical protein
MLKHFKLRHFAACLLGLATLLAAARPSGC